MREIKFRAWFKAKQEIISWKQLSLEFKDGFTTIWIPKNKSIEDAYDLDDIELMQYTGLKDKNGKEIYEGDIVKVHKGKYVVEYWTGQLLVSWFLKSTTSGDTEYMEMACIGECEVIGNIYENPELLKSFQ